MSLFKINIELFKAPEYPVFWILILFVLKALSEIISLLNFMEEKNLRLSLKFRKTYVKLTCNDMYSLEWHIFKHSSNPRR